MTGNIWALRTVDISRRVSWICLAECGNDEKSNSHTVSTGEEESYCLERQLTDIWPLESRWSHAVLIRYNPPPPADIIPHVTRHDLCPVTEKMFFSIAQVFDTTAELTMLSPARPEKTDVQSLPVVQHPTPTGHAQSHTVTHTFKRGSCQSISVQKFSREDRHKQAWQLVLGMRGTLIDSALSAGLETFISSWTQLYFTKADIPS